MEQRNKRFQEIIMQSPSSENCDDTDFYHQYVNIQDMRLDMNRLTILTDIFLTVVMLILAILEFTDSINNPVSVMTRVYLKLPFVFCLWNHH